MAIENKPRSKISVIEKKNRNEYTKKEKYLLREVWTSIISSQYSLVTHDKKLTKTVEKLFKLHIMGSFHPSKCITLKD